MRLFHLADVHLDRPFVGLSFDAARERRAGLMEALRRCLELAVEREADVVTIGGDLWEDENVTPDTRASVAHALERVQRPVIIVTGNHDPYLRGGLYHRTLWPANVRVVDGAEPIEIDLGDVVLRAASWTDREPNVRDLLSKPADDARVRVALFHGTAADSRFPTVGAYGEFDPALIEAGPIAVALLGHIHEGSSAGRVVYPGSPEPLNRSETGRHCCAVVDVSGDDVAVELIDVNRRRYRALAVDCTDAASSEEVETRVRDALGPGGDRAAILSIELRGETAPDCDVDPDLLKARLDPDFAAVTVQDCTEPQVDYEQLRGRHSADGLFVAELLRRIDGAADPAERRVLELALRAGVRAMSGHKDVLRVG